MKQTDFNTLLKKYLKTLSYSSYSNPGKLIITFSAIPGSGKTFLAKRLEEDYKALRISNDEIREIIRSYYKISGPDEVQKKLNSFLELFINSIVSLPNKIIIFDSSIDRKYDIVKSFYEPIGYSIFIISFEISLAEIKKRIKRRDSEVLVDYHLKNLGDWSSDTKKLQERRKPDFVIKDNSAKEYLRLRKSIDKRLSR